MTEQERKYWRMSRDIMDGMTFEDAAMKHGIESKQACQYRFRVTCVKMFLSQEREIIKQSNFDLKKILQLWREYNINCFKIKGK